MHNLLRFIKLNQFLLLFILIEIISITLLIQNNNYQANKIISHFIEKCYYEGVSRINVITGKGLRSKNKEDPFKSNDLSILKYSVPNFIKNNLELMKKIKMIDFDSVNSSLKGSFDIILKKKL